MKKSLVITLALVFVLGIAGTAFAANPFTDVPANHWAYASISKLAQAGIIDGYGDGRFIGNNTMTRYEMAQIVAKAMAKVDSADAAQRAQIEKLAAEFADELDSLGVRVAKLEKNADNVKITGEARFSNWAYDRDERNGRNRSELRSRIWLSGQVNDRWSYKGMFENTHNFKTNSRDNEQNVNLRRAWVEGSLGVVNVTAGRFAAKPVYGVVFDNDADGIQFGYKTGDFKIDVFALRMDFGTQNDLQTLGVTDGIPNNQVIGTELGYSWSKLDLKGAYYHTDPSGKNGESSNIYELAVGYKFDKNWKIWAEYLRGSKEINNGGKSGWAARLDYGQTVRNKPGTWAARVVYYDVPGAATFDTTPMLDLQENAAFDLYDGFKGWEVGASWMAAKNIDLNVEYYDFDKQDESRNGRGDKLLFSYVRFYF